MTQRACDISSLTESAEKLRAGPPWWLHAVLFALSILLIFAAVMFFAWTAV
jgi:hypothetical protein